MIGINQVKSNPDYSINKEFITKILAAIADFLHRDKYIYVRLIKLKGMNQKIKQPKIKQPKFMPNAKLNSLLKCQMKFQLQ